MENLFENMEIDPGAVVEMQKNGVPFKLLDVREQWEFEYVSIPGAILFPMDQIEARHAAELDKSETLVLYCHAGMRSWQGAAWLRQEGYTNARSLSGGINRWADDVDPDMPRY